MTVTKRPKLFVSGDRDRTQKRQAVRIPGECRIGQREPEEIFVTDITDRGCCLRVTTIGVTKDERVVLRFGEEEPIAGRLKWTRQPAVGIAFDEPLEDGLIDRLIALIPDNVVPIRRSPLR